MQGVEHQRPLGDDLAPLRLGQLAEGLDDEVVSTLVEFPDTGEEAVDEEGAVSDVALPGAAPVLGRYDPGAVGVGEEQVVELREETRRGRGVGGGAGSVREVEEFDAVRVVEGDELGP